MILFKVIKSVKKNEEQILQSYIELTEIITKPNFDESKEDNIDNDSFMNERNDRYVTTIELFGFGKDMSHIHLGPHSENNCFKIELYNSGYVNKEQWTENLNKAFHKFKQLSNNTKHLSKQYSKDYNILRGDRLKVHHLLAIFTYTKHTKLCTKYRTCFRAIYENERNDEIIFRHSKFYFFSRFLFEAIEFYGSVLEKDMTVYHGLNQPFLFSHFSTHFNAPTSTTYDEYIAQNFAKGPGIVLELQNGNKDIQNDVISKYKSYQPRYMNVNWISPFDEKEWLFFGDNIILQIVGIRHKEINAYTIKVLNLLQRLIKNKRIDWNLSTERGKKGRNIKRLADMLERTRNMNIDINDNDTSVHGRGMDGFEKLLKKNTVLNDCLMSLKDFLRNEEYDSESVYFDVMSEDNVNNDKHYKYNSNIYLELNNENNIHLMETIERYFHFSNIEQISYLKSTLTEAMNVNE
eukprot:531323_1